MSRVALPRLHVITDDAILRRSDFLDISLDLLVNLQRNFALHLRGHELSAADLFQLANSLAAKAAYVGTGLFINDRCDIALAFDDVGAQLGSRSVPLREARRLLGNTRRIGYSAHSAVEAAEAERDGADFVLAGTIYRTASHPGVVPGGAALLADMVEACSVPVLAIGGITAERVPEVLSTGAYGVAVIRAVWDASDPVQAATEFAKMLI